MGRTIVAGSRVLLDAPPAPRFGEIWAWSNDDGEVVVHRCLGRSGDRYRFQGDARKELDPPVRPAQIIGRVVAVEHGGRTRPIGRRDRSLGTARLLARSLARGAYRAVVPHRWRLALRRRR